MEIRLPGPDDGFHRVHTYFKGSPYHPDGRRILYTRFGSLRETGAVCTMDRLSGEESVLGASRFFTYHHGAAAWFCDGGRRVIYQRNEQTVVCHDLKTGKEKRFRGTICLYSGNLREQFIETDADYPAEQQGQMGIYLRKIDGTGKRCLATVDDLLAANPQGASIGGSRVLLRLGGEISPDQKSVILFLVTQQGTLVRDYYTCDMDGSSLTFHGRLGTHIMWHPNCRDVLAFVSPRGCSYFPHLRGRDTNWGHGLLGSYDTTTRRMTLLSRYRIPGGCHVSPSPDGTRAALDSLQPEELGILLYDYGSGRMRRLCRQKRDLRVEPVDDARLQGYTHGYKHYDVNAHPAFSHDSRMILFNACTDGRVRLCEIEL